MVLSDRVAAAAPLLPAHRTLFNATEPTRAIDNGRQHVARYGQNGRVMALGRKNALFAGSDGGARHWAIVASLMATARLNGVEPLAWLTDVLERVVSGRTKAHELERLLPWAWKAERLAAAAHA